MMKATSIKALNSQPAPKEWEQIEVLKKSKSLIPAGKYTEISLQRLVDSNFKPLNIAVWYGAAGGTWHRASNFFIIE